MNNIEKNYKSVIINLNEDQKNLMKSFTIFFIMIIAATILNKSFLKTSNIVNLITQNVLLGIVAFGQFFVILTGGIDLSVGSIIGFSSVAIILFGDLGSLPAITLTLIIVLILGLVNGILITYVKLPPFVVTLAMMQIVYSITQVLSNGASVYNGFKGAPIPEGFVSFFRMDFLGIKISIYIYLIFIVIMYLYSKTTLGHFTYALGGNERTAKISGIPANKVKVITYMISSFLAGVGGIIYIMRVNEGTPQAGINIPLDSIAAVIIGGASFSGGSGTLTGTIIGVFTIGILSNILNLLTVSPLLQPAAKGIIILLAIYMNTKRKKI